MVRGAVLFLLEEGSSLGSRDVKEVYEGSDVKIALPWADVSLVIWVATWSHAPQGASVTPCLSTSSATSISSL